MLASALDSFRLFLHIFGATIWVGGQFTLAALVPILRRRDPELPRIAARAFNKIGWSAFALLILTGAWNLAKVPKDATNNYHMVIGIKMTVVLLSGVAAFVHTRSTNVKSIAIWGSISGVMALAATYIGVLLAG
ncbi:MAG: hypothetical protein WCP64_05930 [Actinomycetes bacterium]|jgi:putative copper export protein